jgi:glycosyltransferase involved in cell wall biosynthesis
MPKVSVIIPCYNQGEYLEEAVNSVLNQTFSDFEIIVVNDGSDETSTICMLENFRRPKTRVIHTPNKGLAAARNNGIAHARSPYILPLDADDKIGSSYLEQGTAILDQEKDVGIVYCLAEKFGAKVGPWVLPEFSPERLCIENMIFCSALFRRSDWQRVGGYNTIMKYGWEDWDFWLSLVERGRRVVKIPDILFWYRVSKESMTRTMTYRQKLLMMSQLIVNHKGHYARNAHNINKILIGISLS